MSFTSWLQTIRSATAPGRSQRNHKRWGPLRAATHRSTLEVLEDRCVPALYAVTDLGTLSVSDLNNAGQVVGQASTTDGFNHAFLWDSGTMIDLGTLGGTNSAANGINDLGQVAGTATTPGEADLHAFLITPQGGVWFHDSDLDGRNDFMIDLGTLNGNNSYSSATDINNAGQVVGFSDGYAFVWDSLNGMTELGVPPGFTGSQAYGINDAGNVTGVMEYAQQTIRTFLWKNGTVTDLGEGGGMDINNAGQVVDGLHRLWTPAEPNGTSGTFTYLPTLTPPEEYVTVTYPAGMNNLGHVVGSSVMTHPYGYSYWVGFVYGDPGMEELPLDSATAINDAGQIIGNRGDRAYLLAPFTPAPPDTLVSITNTTVAEGNAGATEAVFTVTLSAAVNREVTVDYYTGDDGWAIAGEDYVATIGTLRFTAGQTTQTITVPVIGDQMSEPQEYFYVNLDNPSSNAAINRGQAVGVILDDDPPEIRISDVSWQEGNTGTNSLTFFLDLSFPGAQPISVNYATASGSATAGSDYQATSGTLTFVPGETSKTITILVNGDRLPEPNETFFVNLSSPTNATITDGQGVGTIVDDEPRVSISNVSKKEGKKNQTSQFTFTVTLSTAYDQAVTMSFQTVNGTATTSDGDFVAKTSRLTFAPGETTKTIAIEVKGDGKQESDETFYLDLYGLSGNALFTKNRGNGSILNDD